MALGYTYSQIIGTSSTGTYNNLYNTVGSPAKTAVISTIVVCNTSALPVTYRIGLSESSTNAPGTSEFLVFDQVIQANFTVALTLGIAMPSGRYLKVSSSAPTLAFSAFVSEIS